MEVIPILLAAGSATADNVALNGGMSLIDGTFIAKILSGIIGAVGGIVATVMVGKAMWTKKEEKLRARIADELKAKIVNDPLNVHPVPSYVTCDECAAHRASIGKRLDAIGPTLERIFKKLTEIDRKDEERINSVHRRVDPLIEKLAATSAEVEVLKERK